MSDYIDVTLRAAVRSLRDVVVPALPADEGAAAQQAGLVADFLEFCLEKLDHLASRERFDVTHYLRMSEQLCTALASAPAVELDALTHAAADAQRVLEGGTADRGALREAAACVSGAITGVVRAADAAEEPVRLQVGRIVVTASVEREVMERAWFAAAGLDPDPSDVPPFLDLLAGS